jgi:hypothetical protein
MKHTHTHTHTHTLTHFSTTVSHLGKCTDLRHGKIFGGSFAVGESIAVFAGVSHIGKSSDKSIAIGENVAVLAKVSQFGKSNALGHKKQHQAYRSFGESTAVLARV